jgi:hypothetical protein
VRWRKKLEEVGELDERGHERVKESLRDFGR